MENVSGKAHSQTFEVSCGVEALELRTTGVGSTRREAEQRAASEMLGLIEQGQR